MKKRRKAMEWTAVFLFVMLASINVAAQSTTIDVQRLQSAYAGKLVRVRHLVADSKIKYDASGKLTGKWHVARWRMDLAQQCSDHQR